MQSMFDTLVDLFKEPLPSVGGVSTDNSILLVYPPDRELEFRDELVNACFPALEAQGVAFRALDLSGFLFEVLGDEAVAALQEEEFDDYDWMVQGLQRKVEGALKARLTSMAREHPGSNVVVYGTVTLFPLVRFGEILRDLRDLDIRIAVAFPGEERGGRLHFMNQPDGGNYLAVKLSWR